MAFDSIIIGAGPAGITAALYLARFGVSVGLVEKETLGGLVLQTAELENYPGFAQPVRGYELVDAMEAQIAPFDSITRIRGGVSKVDFSGEVKTVTVGETTYEAKAVILASGVVYRKLGLEDEARFLGKGVSHCAVCDGQFYRGKVVGVVGGGNSALEEALYLARIVSHVHIIHRREGLRADKTVVDRVRNTPNITLELSEVPVALNGAEFLESVTTKHVVSGKERILPMDCLFVFIGFLPSGGFWSQDLKVDKDGFILTDGEMLTNIPGVFAAGDIRSKFCRQVVTATGDGATAANSAYRFLEQAHV